MEHALAKGTLWIMFARVIFLFNSYLVHIFLGRYFGPSLYGSFGVVLSLMVISEIFLQKGLPQAASKYISENRSQEGAVYRSSLRLQFCFALFFTLVYFLSAGFLADFLKDPNLAGYIRFSSLLILPVAFFSLYTDGFLNGQRLFKQQSYIRVAHSLLKLVFVFALVFLGFKIYGAIGAYILAYLLAFFIARFCLRIAPSFSGFSQKKIIFFALPLIISSAVYILIRNIDLLLIKRLLVDYSLAGFYTSAMTLAGATYMVFAGSSLTLLPSISQALAEKNLLLAQKYIHQSLRYVALFLFPSTFLISATSLNLVELMYSSQFSPAAPALSILIFSSAFLAFFVMLCSIIAGGGEPKKAMLFGLVTIPISAALNIFFIPHLGIKGAALATTLASFIGFALASTYVFRKFKTLFSLPSLFKIVFASLLVYYLALRSQFSGFLLILTYFILFGVYFAILFALNEIKSSDIALVKNLIKIKSEKC